MEQKNASCNGCKIGQVWAESQNGDVKTWALTVRGLTGGMVVKDLEEPQEPYLALSRKGQPLGWFRFLEGAQKAVEAEWPDLVEITDQGGQE
ncbi:MAG: hypothetical protein IV090_19855 [Candidatus Sericytochromatia bacterium]|nr:hypothetical protein [Candidatus Sericytochromatia bacterium]